ncbi:biotin synthase, partial [Xanthomonas perforans]|nr:biotin synthase [Xanthomonas perforans]
EKLLTTGNPDTERDQALFKRLGLRPMQITVDAAEHDHPGTVHAEITRSAACEHAA